MARSETASDIAADVSTVELQQQIAALKTDIAELTAAVGRYGRAQSEVLKSQARDGIRMVADRGASGVAAAGDFAGQKYSETEDYVRTHPAASVGIAAGVGFLVGLLTARG